MYLPPAERYGRLRVNRAWAFRKRNERHCGLSAFIGRSSVVRAEAAVLHIPAIRTSSAANDESYRRQCVVAMQRNAATRHLSTSASHNGERLSCERTFVGAVGVRIKRTLRSVNHGRTSSKDSPACFLRFVSFKANGLVSLSWAYRDSYRRLARKRALGRRTVPPAFTLLTSRPPPFRKRPAHA
ncbi:hypothetical protein AWB78_07562 [Caballeronia calidae]|uniref:Uncharacterized protein n=1 Tax=Caballeronia calidae TaxID=1777139 RepID=A0A158EF73_9BURK|nr:hypothetical protein AWB78_07562 [Caballeronia calidae]